VHSGPERAGESGATVRWASGCAELATRWRAEAALLRRRGAELQAVTLESCAVELEAHEREQALEALTLERAAQESGYSYSALQKLVATGTLANVGRAHAPRVRRGDLPRKVGRAAPAPGGPDLAALIRGGRR
jgi:hypothetical protein